MEVMAVELSDVKGIGPKSVTLLNKLNIYGIDDLITYYPMRYDVLKRDNLAEIDFKSKSESEKNNSLFDNFLLNL